MAVSLTPAAAARISAIAARQQRPARLRLAVEGGGCSGFRYAFALADTANADDLIIAQDQAELLVDTLSLDLIDGAVVDYVESLGGAAFRVSNPKAAAGCGCGASFAI